MGKGDERSMTEQHQLMVLLPTRDEEGAIGATIERIPLMKLTEMGYVTRILVADGRSTDATQDIALSMGCDVLTQRGEMGKGIGLRQGFEFFLSTECDALVMLDADGTYDPHDMTKLLETLENGQDVVIGSRLRGTMHPEAMSRLNYLGNHLLTWSAVVLHGAYISDLCTGYWAFTRRALENIYPLLNSVNFEIEAEMYAAASALELNIDEVPIHYGQRIGVPKLGSINDGARILRKILTRAIIRVPISHRIEES